MDSKTFALLSLLLLPMWNCGSGDDADGTSGAAGLGGGGSAGNAGTAGSSGSAHSGGTAGNAAGGTAGTGGTAGGSGASGGSGGTGGGPPVVCAMPTGAVAAESKFLDFTTIKDPVKSLNGGGLWIRTVFPVGPGQPGEMVAVSDGVKLTLDVSTFPAGVLDAKYRAELREQDTSSYPPNGTTQIYRRQFIRNTVPSVLYGKLLVFQRFNRDLDGPDCHVTLVGDHQWSDDTKTGYIWIDCAGERTRDQNTFLKNENDLVVAIYTHPSKGKYKISLNGKTVAEGSGLDTSSATAGGWVQFGTYWSGMIYGDEAQRKEQVASGESTASFTEHRFEKHFYSGEVDLTAVKSYDPNVVGGFVCP